jgi:N utilization substance protein B
MGAFELSDSMSVPYRVVINECIELGKVFGATDGHKYVNSILDKLALEHREIETSAKQNQSSNA